MMELPFRDTQRKVTKEDMIRARIPEEHWKVSFSKVPSSEYKKAYSLYLDAFPHVVRRRGCVVLMGTFGSGKSSLANFAQKRIISWGGSTLFVTASEAVGFMINDRMSFDEDFTFKDRMHRVDLLVIDDLGMEAAADGANSCLEQLIRSRLSQNRSTVITSNLNKTDLEKRYPGVYQALLGSTMFINVTGINWRQDKQDRLAKKVNYKRSKLKK